jgi:hypothetical protein
MDGLLCGGLAIVLFNRPAHPWRRLMAVGLAGGVVGVLGHALLAHRFYDVAPSHLVSWALGHVDRPEVKSQVWGRWSNITGHSLLLALINHAMYTVVIPGLTATRSAAAGLRYSELPGGWIAPLFWCLTLAASLSVAGRSALGSLSVKRERVWLLALAALWLFPRVVFSAWWDPQDPFLFAVLSLPALWLVLLASVAAEKPGAAPAGRAPTIVLFVTAAAVWLHNTHYLIAPLAAPATK